MSREKKEARQREQAAAAPDALALEAQIRKRYASNWPAVILELSKRVTGVNTRWQNVMADIRAIPDCEVSYHWIHEGLVIRVRVGDEGEETVVSHHDCIEAQHYMEVMVMDVIAKNSLIQKKLEELNATPKLPG